MREMDVHAVPKTFCEFFAGIGLMHEALRATGWQLLYANDIDAKKRAMHAGHFGDDPRYHEGDVWATSEVVERIEGTPFLATASFPCTDMSLAGKRQGFQGAESGALFGFLQVVEQLAERRPRMLLLENVTGFLTARDGHDFAAAASHLDQLDYLLDALVLDARYFVPQSRPRLFLIAYHASLSPSPCLIHRDPSRFLDDPWRQAVDRSDRIRPPNLLRTLDQLVNSARWATVDSGNPPQATYQLLDVVDLDANQAWWDNAELTRHTAMFHDRHREKIAAMQAAADQTFAMTGYRRMRAGKQRLEVRFDGVAGCLRTPRGGSAKQIVIVVDRGELRMRWMTPREYARLQGAPDFVLPDNTIQGLFGFGDAVCVPAIRWIDQQILTPVYESLPRLSPLNDGRPVYAN